MISFIIPCYNEASFLVKTLENLAVDRTIGNYEIIVSDDNSEDNSIDLATGLADKIVTNPGEERGTARARNRGVKVANGRILIFIDADILVQQPLVFVSKVREYFKDPELQGATAACRVYPDQANSGEKVFHFFYNHYLRIINLLGIGIASGWCQIVRKETFEEIHGYDPSFVTGQDVDLFRRLCRRGKTRLFNDLRIHESPRRYRQTGLVRLICQWSLNCLWVVFLRRPYLKKYPAIR